MIACAEKCRICGGPLFSDFLLQYKGAPSSAQGFATSKDDIDKPIDLNIVQCSKCGLVQHNLPPVRYYKEVIRAVAFSEEMAGFRKKQLHDWIDKNNLQNKSILEVGCGKGEYIQLLNEAGACDVAGIEFSRESVNAAKAMGHKVYEGFIDSSYVCPKHFVFDAFTIFSFMEHWPSPDECLQSLYSCLSQDAVGLIEVPNFELILKSGLYSEFTIDHIFYFDQKSLSFLLEKNGFEVVSIRPIWYDYILSAEVQKRPLIDIGNFLQVQNNIKHELYSFVKKYIDGSVAIWGAGHQALAVIAMANIAQSIKYIVDSADFKQGKFTPGSGLPVVSPDTLLKDVPEAIVVMAAGYSNEIVNILQEKYQHIKNIAVLREDRIEIIK